jgi:hypothetical protein
MTYVPIVTPTPAPPLSPRTRELRDLLSKVVEEYTKAHPAMTKAEIRAALRLAQVSGGSNSTAAVLSISLGLGVAMLLLGVFYFRAGGDLPIRPVLPMIIGVAIVLFGILALVRARSG